MYVLFVAVIIDLCAQIGEITIFFEICNRDLKATIVVNDFLMGFL